MKTIIVNNKNHKNLKSNVPFEELPKWFREAQTENAEITYITNILTWYDGEWLIGEWRWGKWHSGHWVGGEWHDGKWHGENWFSNTNRPE